MDIGAIEFIHRKLIELRDAGTAVLLVSAELEEVTALADRLLVINKGKFVGEVDPKTLRQRRNRIDDDGRKIRKISRKQTRKDHESFLTFFVVFGLCSRLIFLSIKNR